MDFHCWKYSESPIFKGQEMCEVGAIRRRNRSIYNSLHEYNATPSSLKRCGNREICLERFVIANYVVFIFARLYKSRLSIKRSCRISNNAIKLSDWSAVYCVVAASHQWGANCGQSGLGQRKQGIRSHQTQDLIVASASSHWCVFTTGGSWDQGLLSDFWGTEQLLYR